MVRLAPLDPVPDQRGEQLRHAVLDRGAIGVRGSLQEDPGEGACTGSAPTCTSGSTPASRNGAIRVVKTRRAASHLSSGLKTLPTSVRGMGVIGRGSPGALRRALPYESEKLPLFCLATRLELHVGHRQLADVRIRLAHHGRELDGRVLVEDLLDRRGIDVVAAPDDQVLGPPGEPEIAVCVESPEITRVDPALFHPGAPVVLGAHVPGEHAGTAHGYHADLVDGAVPLVLSLAVQLRRRSRDCGA